MDFKGSYIIGFVNLPEKNLPADNIIPMDGIPIQCRNIL